MNCSLSYPSFDYLSFGSDESALNSGEESVHNVSNIYQSYPYFSNVIYSPPGLDVKLGSKVSHYKLVRS